MREQKGGTWVPLKGHELEAGDIVEWTKRHRIRRPRINYNASTLVGTVRHYPRRWRLRYKLYDTAGRRFLTLRFNDVVTVWREDAYPVHPDYRWR